MLADSFYVRSRRGPRRRRGFAQLDRTEARSCSVAMLCDVGGRVLHVVRCAGEAWWLVTGQGDGFATNSSSLSGFLHVPLDAGMLIPCQGTRRSALFAFCHPLDARQPWYAFTGCFYGTRGQLIAKIRREVSCMSPKSRDGRHRRHQLDTCLAIDHALTPAHRRYEGETT